MNKIMFGPLVAAMMSGCCLCNCDKDPVIGNWGLKLPYDYMAAGSMIFTRDVDDTVKAYVLLRWASPEWCVDVQVKGESSHRWRK